MQEAVSQRRKAFAAAYRSYEDRQAYVVVSSLRRCLKSQNWPIRVHRGVPQGSFLGPVLFSLFINNLFESLASSISCSLYADNLAIWSSSHSVSAAVEPTLRALIRQKRWSEYWCLPFNLRKCEASFFSVDPHQEAKIFSSAQGLTLYLCFLLGPL